MAEPLRPLHGLPPATQAALAVEAARLIADLAAETEVGEPGRWLAAHGLAAPADVPTVLPDGAARAIGRTVGTRPIAAMLAAAPDPDARFADRVDRLRGWGLIAAAGFVTRSGVAERHDTVKRGLRPLRQLVEEAPLKLLWDALPLPEGGVRAAMLALEELAQRLERGGSGFAPRLVDLAALLRTHVKARSAWHVWGRAGKARPMPPPAAPFPDPGLEDAGLRGARVVEPVQTLGTVFRTVEEAKDAGAEPRRVWAGFVMDDEARSAHARALKARARALATVDRDRPARAEYGALTPAEARRIWRAATEALARDPDSRGAALCAAALAFGRSPDALVAAPRRRGPAGVSRWRRHAGAWALEYAPAVTPAAGVIDDDEDADAVGALLMLAPPQLAPGLSRLLAEPLKPEVATKIAREWLRKAAAGGRPLRLSRLPRFLADALAQDGRDLAIVGALSGAAPNDVVQLYYAVTPVAALDDAWRWLLCDRLGAIPHDGPAVVGADGAEAVGSERAPSRAAVARLFARLRRTVEASRGEDRSAAACAALHGAFTDHAASLLTFCAFRRPHHDALEPLDQLVGSAAPILRVSDKESRAAAAARWLPMPGVALSQLGALRRHLAAIGRRFRFEAPGVFDATEAALAGSGPSFFLIDAATGAVRPLSAAALAERAALGADVHRNWARHFMRRELTAEGVAPHLVDALMGHGGLATDPFLGMSGFAVAGLCDAVPALDRICAAVGCHSLEGYTDGR